MSRLGELTGRNKRKRAESSLQAGLDELKNETSGSGAYLQNYLKTLLV